MSGIAVLRLIAAVELGTLALLLLNLFTVRFPEVSSVLGPVHGLAYLCAIICAAAIAGGRHRPWMLALIPGLGGVLAARDVTRFRESRPRRAGIAQDGEGRDTRGGTTREERAYLVGE